MIEETPYEINGVVYPVDTTRPNPNGEEMHNLYLDFNGIVHPCSHPENKPPPADESEMMMEVFKYTERVVNMVRPRRLLYIAIDGVAPRAKMNQQRARRFRSAMDAAEADEKKAELQVLLRQQRASRGETEDVESVIKKTWDSNVITPGTPFMFILAQSIRFWCQWKLNTDPAWADIKVIISDASVPGEGEHKIMEFIRSQRSDPDYDPNTRHVMYGLDADLIMLGIATHEPHFRVLREDVSVGDAKAKVCKLCGQPGHYADQCRGEAKKKSGQFDEKAPTPDLKPFIFLHVPILREYLGAEMYVPGQEFRFDLERALDDWVFMCFFVGNDFLPHLPSLDIHEDGIDKLIAIWRDNVPIMGGYLTCDGQVDLARAQVILEGLAKQEDAIFKKRKENDDRRERNQARRDNQNGGRGNHNNRGNGNKRRRGSPDYGRGGRNAAPLPINTVALDDLPDTSSLSYNLIVNRGAAQQASNANKSAAAVLKEKLMAQKNGTEAPVPAPVPTGEEASPLGKRKAELISDAAEDEPSDIGTPGRSTPVKEDPPKKKFDPDNLPPDTVKMWEEGYADRYYEQKFHVSPTNIDFRHEVARAYVEGLAWVLLYYFQGCASWTWYYPYHYAPFAADFVGLDKMEIKFEKGKAFRPYEQLMGVLPAASNHAIPKPFHSLMTDEDSEIIDFYPEDFELDPNGKKQSWKAIVLLPFIDEKRLLSAMSTKYPELTEEENMRNAHGHEALIVSDKHPLYEDLVAEFYSKKSKSGPKDVKLNMRKARLAGTASKNDNFLPHMALKGPEEDITLDPVVEDDCTLSVHYELPPKTHVHKSMLFPGVVLPPAVLDNADVAILKSRARNAGRDFGGAPLYDNSARDRMADAQFPQKRINYASDRAPLPPRNGNVHANYPRSQGYPAPPDPRNLDPNNPFAAFLDPNFAQGMPRGPPPPPQHGYVSQGYNTQPPPPQQYGHHQQQSYHDNRDGYGSGQGNGQYGQGQYGQNQYNQQGGQNGYGRR